MQSILYIDKCSAPVRSCLMLIKHLNMEVELKELDLFKGEQLRDEFKKINPAHTVPTLVDNDLTLTDSHAILIHLCERHQTDSSRKLWPKEYNYRMRVLNLLLFEVSVLFRRNSYILSEIFYKSYKNVDVKFHKVKIFEIYNMLEQFLSNNEFMALSYMTIADWSILSSLSTSDLFFPLTKDQWPLLYQWFMYMKSLPEYDINREGLKKLQKSLEIIGKCQLPIKS